MTTGFGATNMPGQAEIIAATMPKVDHYHVFAVQDLGGTQEAWKMPQDDQKLTLEQARQLASDMKRADWLFRDGPAEFTDPRMAIDEFGDRLYDLISDNVAPGWDAIFVVDCHGSCELTFHKFTPDMDTELKFCAECRRIADNGICDPCNDEIQKGFAVNRVRTGWADDNDLEMLGITRTDADQVQRRNTIDMLASLYRNDPDVLREALAKIPGTRTTEMNLNDGSRWTGTLVEVKS